jgi:hypothetical protein
MPSLFDITIGIINASTGDKIKLFTYTNAVVTYTFYKNALLIDSSYNIYFGSTLNSGGVSYYGFKILNPTTNTLTHCSYSSSSSGHVSNLIFGKDETSIFVSGKITSKSIMVNFDTVSLTYRWTYAGSVSAFIMPVASYLITGSGGNNFYF